MKTEGPTGLVSWSEIFLLNSIAVFETVRSFQFKKKDRDIDRGKTGEKGRERERKGEGNISKESEKMKNVFLIDKTAIESSRQICDKET